MYAISVHDAFGLLAAWIRSLAKFLQDSAIVSCFILGSMLGPLMYVTSLPKQQKKKKKRKLERVLAYTFGTPFVKAFREGGYGASWRCFSQGFPMGPWYRPFVSGGVCSMGPCFTYGM